MKGRWIKIENNKSPTEETQLKVSIPQHYIRIPKEIILQDNLSEHRISALIYLHFNQTWEEFVHYSPIYMIQWCGYKPNWHRGTTENIFTKFKESMQWLYENGYILDFDKDKYVQNTFQSSLLNKDKMIPKNNYGMLFDFEIEAIMNHQSSYKPLNKSILLLLLSYIRAFTWVRQNEISGHSEKSKKEKPEIFHSQFQTMENFIHVKARMISKATTVLEELGLIKTHRMSSYQDSNGVWHTDDIIYICPYKLVWNTKTKQYRICNKEEYDWHKELEYGINYLRECKYSSKKFYQD